MRSLRASRRARSREASTMSGLLSMPLTRPLGPISRAISQARKPMPQPTSRPRSPSRSAKAARVFALCAAICGDAYMRSMRATFAASNLLIALEAETTHRWVRRTPAHARPLAPSAARAGPRRSLIGAGGDELRLRSGRRGSGARLQVHVIVIHRRRAVGRRTRVPARRVERRGAAVGILSPVDEVAVAHHADQVAVIERDRIGLAVIVVHAGL